MDVAGPHWKPVSNFKNWKAPPVSKRHQLLFGQMQSFASQVCNLQVEAFHVCHVSLGSFGDQSLRKSEEWKCWGGREDWCRWLCRSTHMLLEGKKYSMRVELLKG